MPTLTLATWNVQNLFRPAPGDAPAAATYEQKIPLLAQTIRDLNPDVIALEEVGSADALADLQAALNPGWPNSRLGVPDSRGIACAFLSKLAFDETENVVQFPQAVRDLHLTDMGGQALDRMGRGALRVRVTKGGFRCHLISVHLKSKLLTFPGGAFSTNDETVRAKVAALALMRRTAEAAAVRITASNILAAQPAAGVCVLGDFNDGHEAATTQIFQGPDGSELGTRGFDRPDEGDGARLWNLAAAIPAARRFSRIHRGLGELLDQIFVSEEFLPRGADQLRRLPLSVDSRIENIQSIGDNPNAVADRPRPDHAPVTAVFDIS